MLIYMYFPAKKKKKKYVLVLHYLLVALRGLLQRVVSQATVLSLA